MKKEYIKPNMKVKVIELSRMVCVSMNTGTGQSGDKAESKEDNQDFGSFGW